MRTKAFTALLVITFLTTFSCQKETEITDPGNKIELGETIIDTVSYFEAKVTSGLADLGGNEILQHGHCWSTNSLATTDDYKTTFGKLTGPKTFSGELTDLVENTNYYVRSYFTYSNGTIYGAEKTIKTLKTGKPITGTTQISDIALYSAKCSSNVLVDSGLFVTSKGVCWDTSNNFTVHDCLDSTIVGSGIGSFTSNLKELNEGVKYFVKAYGINDKGISYGETVQFTTIPITTPVLTTNDISGITYNTARSGGDVTYDGEASVTARGVCWSTSPYPTTANNHTIDGSDIGSFVSHISGLSVDVQYYVRAYATNSVGIAYGDEFSFKTLSSTPCDGITTINHGGQTYNTIEIGSKCWMAENVNIGTRISGANNQKNNGTFEKYCYEDDEANCDIYGGLYQWEELMQYTTEEGTQGICPSGWHISTNDEWTILADFLGGTEVAGGKMKESGTTHWQSPNTGATNESGFTALPGGYRFGNGDFFNYLRISGTWFTSSGVSRLYFNQNLLSISSSTDYLGGYSVRCVKN